MKPTIACVLFLTCLPLVACGGGGGGSDDAPNPAGRSTVDGRWVGTVQLDAVASCVPSEAAIDLAGKTFALDVSTLNGTTQQFVVDQDREFYSGFSEGGISDGSFIVSGNNSDGFSAPSGVTGFQIEPNDGTTAKVFAFVFYNRFCTTNFSGEFTRIGPVPESSPRPEDIVGRWTGNLSLVDDGCQLGTNPLAEVHDIAADEINVSVTSGGRTLNGQRDSLNSFYSQISTGSDANVVIDSINYSNIANGAATAVVEHFEGSADGCRTVWNGEMRRQ